MVVAVVALGLLANAPCGDRGPTPVIVRNESSLHVYIHVVGPAGRERGSIYELGPRSEDLIHQPPSVAGGCTRQVLIARTKEGREIDRVEPPLCGGETWVIGD